MSIQAVILAGGEGTRLNPVTSFVPKPLVPLGNLPLLEIIIRQLAHYGFHDIAVSLGYRAEQIEAHFNRGENGRFGVSLKFMREETPLGTAGALGQIRGIADTFLVVNGDVLTSMDYRDLHDAHRRRGGMLTVSAKVIRNHISFGVLELHPDGTVAAYREKPQQDYLVSIGVYVYEPAALRYIKPKEVLDVPEMVQRLIVNGEKVSSYQTEALWARHR